jgi:hypothetical protein
LTQSRSVDREYLLSWLEIARYSPLYCELIGGVVDSPELLSVIRRNHSQPPPNVFLGAIHYLLMKGADSPLRGFYPSIVDDPQPIAGVAEPFREFVLAHEDQIVDVANSRLTQTNESRRCVALLPAVMAAQLGHFHLIDLGTSAGLNLAMDRYRYDWDGLKWGPESPVDLATEVRGDPPQLHNIDILSRTGLDLNVLRPENPDDRLWLDALIWPEQHERRHRLRAAMAVATTAEMELIEGDVLDLLAGVLRGLPGDEPAVIVNSFVLNQFEAAQRESLVDLIDEGRAKRRIFRVSLEILQIGDPLPRLEIGEEPILAQLGTAHHHGEWIDLRYAAGSSLT